MICEEKIGQYCRQAVSYKKYSEYRRCDKCCINCDTLCGNLCTKALELINKDVEGD